MADWSEHFIEPSSNPGDDGVDIPYVALPMLFTIFTKSTYAPEKKPPFRE